MNSQFGRLCIEMKHTTYDSLVYVPDTRSCCFLCCTFVVLWLSLLFYMSSNFHYYENQLCCFVESYVVSAITIMSTHHGIYEDI